MGAAAVSCRTYWTGGHLCHGGEGHRGTHTCASTNCPPPVLSAACWGPDAGADRHGRAPAEGVWRQLYNNGPPGRRGEMRARNDEER